MARGRQLSSARNVGRLLGALSGFVQNPEQRSATVDAAQSLAIGVAIVVPLGLWLRGRVARAQAVASDTTAPTPAQGLEGTNLRRMRY